MFTAIKLATMGHIQALKIAVANLKHDLEQGNYMRAALDVGEVVALAGVVLTIILVTIIVSKFADSASLDNTSAFYTQYNDILKTTGDVIGMMGFVPYVAVFGMILAILFAIFRR